MEGDKEIVRTPAEFMEWIGGGKEPEKFLTLSVADALHLPERQLRIAFREIVQDFVCDRGWRWAEANILHLRDRLHGSPDLQSLTTAEMKEILLANQYWFDPDGNHSRAASFRISGWSAQNAGPAQWIRWLLEESVKDHRAISHV